MIDAYDFGRIVIDAKTFTSDVIIFPDRVEDNWWRKDGHVLHIEDIESIVKEQPEVLIVGTGKYGVMTVPSQTREWIESQGIELIVASTDHACKVYNEVSNVKKVVAALHLTC
ncbi:MAG: hypothetical protein JW878_04420 [Methanomicrobia archaeon]|nr:hypothetical protein [Methanomicrobia archaeon]